MIAFPVCHFVRAPSPPAAPVQSLTSNPGDGQVLVSWNPVSGATSYSVYKGQTPGGESATPVLSGITGLSATVTGLTDGTTYYFVVRAFNAGGVSPASNEQSGSPVSP